MVTDVIVVMATIVMVVLVIVVTVVLEFPLSLTTGADHRNKKNLVPVHKISGKSSFKKISQPNRDKVFISNAIKPQVIHFTSVSIS